MSEGLRDRPRAKTSTSAQSLDLDHHTDFFSLHLGNDFKFHVVGSGFRDPDGFYGHIKGAFDVLYEEGEKGMPKMMTIGLHCRIIGRPGRFAALKKFVEEIGKKEGVWVATRTEIAEAFKKEYPYKKGQLA
jgi:peptidoglycan/xylan/chitin deacetylase (PgdA/CDA1 family)